MKDKMRQIICKIFIKMQPSTAEMIKINQACSQTHFWFGKGIFVGLGGKNISGEGSCFTMHVIK